jgi:dihydrofolate reductase
MIVYSLQGGVMGKVLLDLSISLDGYIAGPHDEVDWGLFDWLVDSKTSTFIQNAVMDELAEATGAMIVGRRVFDGTRGWGGSHPLNNAPVFVLTHTGPKPEEVPVGATPFTFVTEGIESALTQAQSAAGDKQIYIIGGANVAQQYLQAGLLDDIQLHLVPILFGEGKRLFDHIGTKHIHLERTRVFEFSGVTHLWFRVVK